MRDDPFAALNTARVVFWVCPDAEHSHVTWTTNDDGTMTPTCQECGLSGLPQGGKKGPIDA